MIEQGINTKKIKLSRIREIMNYCKALEKQGKVILDFTNGEPDFDTPKYIKSAAVKALNDGKTGYASIVGVEELRKAISKKLFSENNLNYNPDEILITNGVTHGIFLAVMSFLNEGDEILLPDPGYTVYPEIAKFAGAIIKAYRLKRENGFQIDISELQKNITSKTKMIALISPNNPIGSVIKKETLAKLAKLTKNKEILILSDEVYEKITYDGNKHHSIAEIKGMRDKTILLNGFSKSYAMTGWRLGYIAAPSHYIEPMMRLNSITTSGVNHFIQWAGIDAFEKEKDECNIMRNEYKKRRDYIISEICKIDKLSCLKPEGAFYIFVNIQDTGLSSEDFVKYIIDVASVALVPGSAFGEGGEGYVRFCYAKPISEISEALKRIAEAIKKLNINN
ncbi:MAG: pyridoxal phosphate-dependent aminotransferase [SAR324 cluster bacterium]|nr:pyridoxal phosphate-dependent aminotransferase [SAR324 cluster bacterium]